MTQAAINYRARIRRWFSKTRPSHASHNQSRMFGLLFKPCATLSSHCCFVYIFTVCGERLCSNFLGEERTEEGKSNIFLFFVPGRSDQSAATVNTNRMSRPAQLAQDDLLNHRFNMWFSAYSSFLWPSQPTIADILNLGWWATAAAW